MGKTEMEENEPTSELYKPANRISYSVTNYHRSRYSKSPSVFCRIIPFPSVSSCNTQKYSTLKAIKIILRFFSLDDERKIRIALYLPFSISTVVNYLWQFDSVFIDC
jgi:hypothetical protein